MDRTPAESRELSVRYTDCTKSGAGHVETTWLDTVSFMPRSYDYSYIPDYNLRALRHHPVQCKDGEVLVAFHLEVRDCHACDGCEPLADAVHGEVSPPC